MLFPSPDSGFGEQRNRKSGSDLFRVPERPELAAKKRGVKFGRKPKLTPEQVVLALRMVDEGQPVPQVADAFGVHETTIYRCLSAAEAAA